jgi:hypothetical protein
MFKYLQNLAIVLALLPLLSFAQNTEFSIKGKSIGMTPEQACEGAEVEDHAAIRKIADQLKIIYKGNSCSVAIASIGGLSNPEPLKMFFWDGRLVRLAARVEDLDLAEAFTLGEGLSESYGRSFLKRNPPFTTDTWRKKGEKLELEITRISDHRRSAGIYLSDENEWARFQRSLAQVQSASKEIIRQAGKADILNR